MVGISVEFRENLWLFFTSRAQALRWTTAPAFSQVPLQADAVSLSVRKLACRQASNLRSIFHMPPHFLVPRQSH